MLINKRKIVAAFVISSVFCVTAQDENLKKLEHSLIARGYELSKYDTPMIRFYLEYEEFMKQHPEEKYTLVQNAAIIVEGVTYFFFFFGSINEPNITVIAHVPYGNGDKREYYKINKNNEPPNLWITIDTNGDGVIEENEGRWAWH
jgi:uncharacterized protein (DUF1919 family)